ncbi:hypothetical protein FGO68_gene4801 [Halteria grandinella]|uniref:Thioredoxin domain-containing protein n=1 Tax=Halteria grandinella TaxID=5974 RepID=A0A8J8NIJ0_HALGN|nr:hypothetical protein FGO68_gene4801 [Halteria grandinella]
MKLPTIIFLLSLFALSQQSCSSCDWTRNLPGLVVSSADRFDNVMNQAGYRDRTVFVEVFLKSCPHCKDYWRFYKEAADRLGKEHPLNFVNVDAASAGAFVERYGLKYVPTVMVFKEGQLAGVYQKQYFHTSEAAYNWLKEQL